MPTSYRARFLATLRTANNQIAALFARLAADTAADLTRAADADGNIPRSATLELQRRANDRVVAMFLGRNRQGELAPFEVLPGGRVLPLSPYMRILWAAITTATRLPVEQNGALLARRLPADVLAVMRRATVDPFRVARAEVAELEVFKPNPLAKYEAPHTWVDPNGYRLSDRVWNASARTRQQLDAYLDAGVREGRGALQMSRELEQFLRPDRRNLRTSAPYGTSASYDAMRLARSEITRAHGAAHEVSAAMNPFVAGEKWNLSPRHPKPDVCDDRARGGPNGDGVYPIGERPSYPPHPHCLCYMTNVLIENPGAVITTLRDDIRRARQELVDKIGPLKVEEFDRLLLGEDDVEPVKSREQELAELRERVLQLSDEQLRAELAELVARIREADAADNEELSDRLYEEQRIYTEIGLERQRLEQERRRREAERERLLDEQRRATEGPNAADARADLRRINKEFYSELQAAIEGERLYNEAAAELRTLYTQRIELDDERLIETDAARKKVLSAELRTLNRRIRELEKLETENINAVAERRKIEERRFQAMRDALYVSDPSDIQLVPSQYVVVESDTEETARRGMAEFNKLVSRGVWNGDTVELRQLDRGSRAFAKPNDRQIYLAPDGNVATALHEVVHVFEIQGGQLQYALDFFDRRTANDTWEKMSDVTGNSNYRDDELTKKDRWQEAYMGKDYGRKFTEILTMGFQSMYEDPYKFAERDPEMFDFIYNLARGRLPAVGA